MASWFRTSTLAVTTLVVLNQGMASAQTCTTGAEPARQQAVGVTVSTTGLRVPEKAWRHFYMAVEEAQGARYDEAAGEIAKSLALAPTFAEPYMLRASLEVSKGRFAEAIEDASAARRVDPTATWAAVLQAGAYNGMRRYREAVAVLVDLPPAQSGTWQAKYEMARATVGMGDAAEALRWSELAAKAAPASCIDTKLLRADAFLLSRRWSEAVEQLTGYVHSEQPQFHRAEALKVLERARGLAAEQATEKLASASELRP